jgi:thioredoxin reductase
MEEYEFAVIGAGPAGLSGAIEAAKAGVRKVVVIDESDRPGGQLIKQTHKFFGGKEHRAKERGIDIARDLAKECDGLGVSLLLNTSVWGIFGNNEIALYSKDKDVVQRVKSKKVLLATGASENPLAFPGWTLPGVLGAGAIQTMMNVHRVSVGNRVLMVGSGNVGLIVSYQLLQAGAKVVAVVDILPRIGGYLVHACKITRLSVPILTSHTVKEVRGNGKVEAATIVKVDSNYQPIPGTEKDFEVDTVCIAVGLSPLAELAWMCGCKFMNLRELGGWVPIYDDKMETTVPGIYVAGDLAGIEEASTAMIEGEIAGLAVAELLGYLRSDRARELRRNKMKDLIVFRNGPFEFRRIAIDKLRKAKATRGKFGICQR